ncbi:GDP dissociation inhibitor [Plasmodium gonderi]|uniref:GDP dissociation inhibitor n=1 Tax=Plasmodium gonderi TaxID=77519 RepID=A0A1Y1JJ02_PLAGO|nr:GDP dissociation inhibitor [Plasmodium gonderi]GAW80074.1 GDP dissociation inhibitor [Plasmodium gonderi]
MDDKKIRTFDCDILICGTSLLNSLLSAYFSINNYKVINIDKNKYYGDVNCSLNFSQFQDEKNKLKNFYEEYIPLSPCENNDSIEKKKKLEKIIHSYFQIYNNKFNIDINPKILYNESNLIDLLIKLNAHTYISFVGIQHFYLSYQRVNNTCTIDVTDKEKINGPKIEPRERDNNKNDTNDITSHIQNISNNNDYQNENDLILLKIPLNKSQVFLDTNLSLIEKRMIMNFIYKNIIHDKNYTFSNFSNYNFTRKPNIEQYGGLCQSSEIITSETMQEPLNNHLFKGEKKEDNKDTDMQHEKRKVQQNQNTKLINHTELSEQFANVNISDYLKLYNISGKLIDYLIYGIGLFDLDLRQCNNKQISEYYLSGYTKSKNFIMNQKEFLQRLHILINSLNKFKMQNLFENAFIYPSYGLNDIIYAISRVACLNNSIYMINRKIQNIIYSPIFHNTEDKIMNDDMIHSFTSTKIKEIILDNGYIIRPRFVISSGSNINFCEMKKYLLCKKKNIKKVKKGKTLVKTYRLMVLSTYSLIGKQGISFYIHKHQNLEEEQKKKFDNLSNSIHILQLDYNSGSCPPGFFLTYFTYLEIKKEVNNIPKAPIDLKKVKGENSHDNPYEKNKSNPKNQKPLNFSLLFDVVKLFIKKHKVNNIPPADSNLPLKIPLNEYFHNIIAEFFSTSETEERSNMRLTDKGESLNEDTIKKKVQQINDPSYTRGNIQSSGKFQNIHKDEHTNNCHKEEPVQNNQTEEVTNSPEQKKHKNIEVDAFVKSLNDLLTKEGVIYCAYYEYEPTIYRKDTIKIINENVKHYEKIFQLIEKNIKVEHQDICENTMNELHKNNATDGGDTNIADYVGNIMNGDDNRTNFNKGKKENIFEYHDQNNHPRTNGFVHLDENKHICNLLFTNDIHNYPIYPLIEDVSMFFYIINKIHRTLILSSSSQTIYDTFSNMIKKMFND